MLLPLLTLHTYNVKLTLHPRRPYSYPYSSKPSTGLCLRWLVLVQTFCLAYDSEPTANSYRLRIA